MQSRTWCIEKCRYDRFSGAIKDSLLFLIGRHATQAGSPVFSVIRLQSSMRRPLLIGLLRSEELCTSSYNVAVSMVTVVGPREH